MAVEGGGQRVKNKMGFISNHLETKEQSQEQFLRLEGMQRGGYRCI